MRNLVPKQEQNQLTTDFNGIRKWTVNLLHIPVFENLYIAKYKER